MTDQFFIPDTVGFEYLLWSGFTEHKGMLFRVGALNTAELERLSGIHGPKDAQRHLNHMHMLLYAADYEVQRDWAFELFRVWRARFRAEYPHLRPHLELEDTGDEFMVTLWCQKVPQ